MHLAALVAKGRQALLEAVDGPIFAPIFVQSDGMLDLREDKGVVESGRLLVLLDRLLELLLNEEDLPSVVVAVRESNSVLLAKRKKRNAHVRILSVDLDGLVKVLHCRSRLSQLHVHARLLDPGLHVVSVKLGAKVEVVQRFDGAAHDEPARCQEANLERPVE